MPTVLLIDDNPELLDGLALNLETEGYTVLTAPDGDRGWDLATTGAPDVIVSDVNMPGIDGFTLCKRLREAGVDTPLVLLTARESDIDEALGLELGADDYIHKPFSTRVLLARLRALLRRRARIEHATPVLQAGPLRLDRDRLEVRWRDTPIRTTLTEFRMLEALASRPGRVLSRDRLLELTRDDDTVVAPRLVDTYIRRLRRKLEAVDPAFDAIETVIGAGYAWRSD